MSDSIHLLESQDQQLGHKPLSEEERLAHISCLPSIPQTTPTNEIPSHLLFPIESSRSEKIYPNLMPYPIESLSEMDDHLELILKHLLEAADAQDFKYAFAYWHKLLEAWVDFRYPIKRSLRARLAALYYNLATSPGLSPNRASSLIKLLINLLKTEKHLDVRDLQLDWKLLYNVLKSELFPKHRATGLTSIYLSFLSLAEYANAYFPPHTAMEMLECFLPQFGGSDINLVLATQSLLCHFLPISHPTPWLDSIFRLWSTFQSYSWDSQWLDLLARLSHKHLDPNASDPRLEYLLKNLKHDQSFNQAAYKTVLEYENLGVWLGIRRDVGIYTERQWSFIMTQCIQYFSVPVGSRTVKAAATYGAKVADAKLSSRALKMLKPTDTLKSFAIILIYSMSEDTGSGDCRALTALSKLLTAMETFFHPSNHGRWSSKLTKFLHHLTKQFARRWSQEAKADQTTPTQWKLTARIKNRFVSMLSPVLLMSMFSKDSVTATWTENALRIAAHLEPSVIVPPIVERSLLALEGLLETHRTTACIAALTAVVGSMLNSQSFPSGGMNLPIILDLLLPGIDPNDPDKTMHSAMLVLQAVSKIKINAITATGGAEEEIFNDVEECPQSTAESTKLVNTSEPDSGPVVESIAFLSDWALTYFQRVMSFFENLPEPQGKQEKAGGKLEESTITFLCASFDELCKAISADLAPMMIDYFKSYICDNVRSNMVKTVGMIASSLSRGIASPVTFQSIYPLCDIRIRAELESGAASIYTMSTGPPTSSDLRLHWFFSIMIGVSTNAGLVLLDFKEPILSLLKLILRDCKSERSYSYTSTFLYTILRALIEYYPEESRFLNPDEWNSSESQTPHRSHWGKTYKAADVKINWHAPSTEEIDFAIVILEEIIQPYMLELNELLHQSSLNHDQKCNFVKLCTIAKFVASGISDLVALSSPDNPGDPATHWGEPLPGALVDVPIMRTGIPLRAPDPRYHRVIKFKSSLSELAHLAATKVELLEENIKCVQSIVGLMSCILLDYACENAVYDYHKESHKFFQEMSRISKIQPEFPRIVWICRAQLAHLTRLRSLKFLVQRSAVDDQLIKDLTEFSVSSWVSIRRSAQKVLDAVCIAYDGSRNLVLPTLLDSLKPGTDSDRMKGAIYVLATKTFTEYCIQHPQFTYTFYTSLFYCQHSDKSSIQSLIARLHGQLFIHRQEISTSKSTIKASNTNEMIKRLNDELITHSMDPGTTEILKSRRESRVAAKDNVYRELVSQLLTISKDPSTHWKYSLHANRVISSFLRRDEPLNARVAAHFINELLNSELPSKRSASVYAITKMLHFVKLRTYSQSDEDLLTKHTPNPLQTTINFPSSQDREDFAKFLAVLQCPLRDHPEYLIDKFRTGWLLGGSEKAYKPPSEDNGMEWESGSEAALKAFKEVMVQEAFWKKLGAHLSQEQTRNYLESENIKLFKSIFQIFGDELWPSLLPTLEELIDDPGDRHKQRAATEIISGVIRGTKHWPLKQQQVVWGWFEERFKKIYDSITPVVLNAWVMCVEYILWARDPRRNQPLVDFILNLETDSNDSAFLTSKPHHFIGSLLRSLEWPFLQPILPKYTEIYWKFIAHDYHEVRSCVSLNLRSLNEAETQPSFRNLTHFLEACQGGINEDEPLLNRGTLSNGAIEILFKNMKQFREVRLPAQHGNQEYDKCSMTVLTWLWSSLSDVQASAIFPFIPRIIPELFYMHEMVDNEELSKLSYAILMTLSSVIWPSSLVGTFLVTLLELSQAKSWKVRLDVLTVLRVFFFHQLYNLKRPQVVQIMESLCQLLEDSNMEVREGAATTLSGMVHCSERESILNLKEKFTKTLELTRLPKKRFDKNGTEETGYQATLIKIHAAVLGSSALVNAFPYEVPPWVPQILVQNLCTHLSSPTIISTTARNTLTTFKKTHQDTWLEGQKMFSEEELTTLNDCLVGSSYYA